MELFVGGSQRSGTTLIQIALCRAFGCTTVLPEAQYLRTLLESYRHAIRRFEYETVAYFQTAAELQAFHATIVESATKRLRAACGSDSVVIFKDPEFTKLFDDIFTFFPEGYGVCMVRDPRDVVTSLFEVAARLKQAGMPREPHVVIAARGAGAVASHVMSFYRRLLSIEPRELRRLTWVRYEDFVSDPEAVVRQVGEFIGLTADFDRAIEEVPVENYTTLRKNTYGEHWLTALTGKAVSDTRVGRYRDGLSAGDQAIVRRVCSPMFERFGY